MSGEAQLPRSEAEDAFEEFVRGRSTHLFRLALVLTGWNRAAAEDVLQIALERAYRRRWLLFRGGAAEPYARRAVVNAAIDWRRVLRRRGEQPLETAVDMAVKDRTGQVADRDVLVRALAAVAPRQRAVLVLRYWEDLSDGEISAMLNCSAGTVRSQASRGLTRLRELTGAQPAARSEYSNGVSIMSDLEQRLRDAMDAYVDGAQPSFDVINAVRRRHRRRLVRVTAASGAAVMAVVAVLVFLGVPHGGPAHPPPAGRATKPSVSKPATPLFPGGGRLLLVDAGSLRWLYPDGRTVQISGYFDGAKISAGELLAWKYTSHGPGYYTMKLNGSQQRLVLPAPRGKQFDYIQAQLSPDGSRLAYIRQQVLSQVNVTFTLWVLDLATGRRLDLGPVLASSPVWRDDTTILVPSADARALLLVNAVTGTRSTYLAVTDPVLVSAYEHARPGAGPPAYIGSDGWRGSGTSSPLAVWLAAATRTTKRGTFPQVTAFTRPAEIVLAGTTPLVTYAPPTPQQLSLIWGPHGLVLLQTGAGDNPGSWNTYAATLQSDRLSRPQPFGMAGATFNPAGNVIALQDDGGVVTFVPTPRPACVRTARCLAFHWSLTNLPQPSTVQAWAP